MSSYPFTWSPISEEEKEEKKKMYTDSAFIDCIRCDQMNVVMPKGLVEDDVAQRIWNFKARPGDVWIVTYPKCGTTMTQELVWQIINLAKGGQLDSEKSKEFLFLRTPFIEMEPIVRNHLSPPPQAAPEMAHRIYKMMRDQIAHAEGLESPRVIKSHLPVSMLSPEVVADSKILVVMRNPKDCCASYYHHEKLKHSLDHDFPFDEYAKLFANGKLCYGDYWDFTKDALKYEGKSNVKVIWFEEMKKDLTSVINDIGEFVGHQVPTDKLEGLLSHMHIDNFRKNDAVNMKPPAGSVPEEVREKHTFIRKGKVGDGKGHFQSKQTEDFFDKWVNENNKDEDGKIIGYTAV